MGVVESLIDDSLHLMNNLASTQSDPVSNNVPRLTYTKAELTKTLGLSSITIYRLEQRGLLHPVQGIRHKLFTVAEVDGFLARREKP